MEEPEVTTIGEIGQVVIPQFMRKELGIKPKNKFLVYGRGDAIIWKKLEPPDSEKYWENILHLLKQKKLEFSNEEFQKEIAGKGDPAIMKMREQADREKAWEEIRRILKQKSSDLKFWSKEIQREIATARKEKIIQEKFPSKVV